MSNLIKHAQKELELAGMFDKDSDYDGALGKAVMELVKVFSKQGHSGFSAGRTLWLFDRVAKFQTIMPIGTTENEWMSVAEGLWQNTRQSSVFSKDGGKTWYDIDAPKKKWYQFWVKSQH